jgi:polyisoprenoid-binding protein YceI
MLLLVALISTATTGPVLMHLQAGSSVAFTAHQTFSSTEGHFKKFSGEFRIDLAVPEHSTVRFELDAASIDTDNESRDEHLRNPDFFDVARYPKIEFRSSTVTETGKGQVRVKGVLHIKGRKVPVQFPMQFDTDSGGKVKASGALTLSRSALGLDYEAPFYIPKVKDKINLRLQAVLQP